MELTNKDIKTILVENPTKKIWTEATQDAKRLQMHVLGHGLQTFISQIETYESPQGVTIRKKYCKSNRDLFARVLRPIDNIWNGRGGGTFYDTSEANQKKLRATLLDVSKGFPIRTWIENFWRPRYIDDPMGLIFMEVNADRTYPTYKASKDIYDALLNGRRLEYIVFKTPDPKVFRVVDDAKDIMVERDTSDPEKPKIKILNTKEYPSFLQWFDKVPALVVSDLPKDGADGVFMSPITDEVELADMFLRDGSIANIYRFKHGFPWTWSYPEICGKCKGQKVLDAGKCPDCDGTGIKLKRSPGDMSVFGWPSKDEPEIKDKGGYISPDLDYLEYADKSLSMLEELIDRTHWGTIREKDTKGDKETATGRYIDLQPIVNRLTRYAKAAEYIEEFITNHEGEFLFNTAYKGCGVNLGRRFMIENPDDIWTRYQDARKNGSPLNALDDLLRDYYETKYQANQQELQKYLQLMKLEPAVHWTLQEAKNLLPWAEYIKKVYFQEFIYTKSETEISFTPIESLRKELEAFAIDKAKTAPVDPLAPKLDGNNNPIPPQAVAKPGVPAASQN
jgi:hypothetical protein